MISRDASNTFIVWEVEILCSSNATEIYVKYQSKSKNGMIEIYN